MEGEMRALTASRGMRFYYSGKTGPIPQLLEAGDGAT
jgi:hypothetical protein